MKKLTLRKAFVLVFLLIYLLPLLTFRFGHDIVSTADNTMLPEISLEDGLDPTQFIDYFRLRLGMRDQAVASYIDLNDKLFDKLEHPSYYWGQDNYSFGAGAGTYNPFFINAFCAYLRQIQDFCQARGVPFLYCLNPSKFTVYREYLPKGYVYSNRFLECMYEKLDYYGVNYISNAEYLHELAATEQVYNRKYDANHWNDLGAYYATNRMLEVMAQDYPAIELLTPSDFIITTEIQESLPVSYFEINEEVPLYASAHEDEVEDLSGFYSDLRVNYPMHYHYRTTDADESLPRVLFFHGSYYIRNNCFYTFSFSEIDAVHNYENILDFVYYFNIFQPEYVVIETAEYATSTAFFDYESLVFTTLPAPLDAQDADAAFCLELDDMENWPAECGLSNFTRTQNEGSNLVKIAFDRSADYSQIYLCADGCEYIMELGDGTAQLTMDVSRSDLSGAVLYLFA